MPAYDHSISSKMLTVIIDRMRASYETFTSRDNSVGGRGGDFSKKWRARKVREEKCKDSRLVIEGN